nr:MAG TPA: hypothetical protein [Caudoviricetes sp.]
MKPEKPTVIIMDELREKIKTAINEARLPWMILEPLIRDLYMEVQALTAQQAEAARRAYHEALEKGGADADN